MVEKHPNRTRRDLLLGAAGLAALYAASRYWLTRAPSLVYEPLETPPGFRKIMGGPTSSVGFDPFIGLDAPSQPNQTIADQELCARLFTERGPGVPIAYFFDHFCPNCRPLSRLLEQQQMDGDITVTRHEWPILGEPSVIAAKAILAADQQGARSALSARLARSSIALDRRGVSTLAASVGLDAEQMLRDMDGPDVTQKLDLVRALAHRFGLFATPSLIIGRTLVIGGVNAAQLDRLIMAESRDPGVCAHISVT